MSFYVIAVIFTMEIIIGNTNGQGPITSTDRITARHCHDYYLSGNLSGVYTIIIGDLPVRVYCIMVSQDGDQYLQTGGYTVIQSRMDPTVDFNRSFAEYEQGFSTPTDEIGSYWIGLRNISFLTDRYSMRLNIRTVLCNGGTQFFADYSSFKHYVVNASNFSTNSLLCDGFNRPQVGGFDNFCPFATIDTYAATYNRFPGCVQRTPAACAPTSSYGGWWFGSCANNFNGQFYDTCVGGETQCASSTTCDLMTNPNNGIRWCTGASAVYKSSVMSLLPTS